MVGNSSPVRWFRKQCFPDSRLDPERLGGLTDKGSLVDPAQAVEPVSQMSADITENLHVGVKSWESTHDFYHCEDLAVA